MPLGSKRPRERNQASLVLPKPAIASQDLAPQSTAVKARTRMSSSRWWSRKARWRGSGTWAKWWAMSRRVGAPAESGPAVGEAQETNRHSGAEGSVAGAGGRGPQGESVTLAVVTDRVVNMVLPPAPQRWSSPQPTEHLAGRPQKAYPALKVCVSPAQPPNHLTTQRAGDDMTLVTKNE